MTETVPAPEDAAAARAADQARLRKERREAKIKAGGTARLNKITGLGGGFQRDAVPESAAPQQAATATPPQSTAPAPPSSSSPPSQPLRDQGSHDDPEEVDISQHFYTPQQRSRPAEPSISDAQLRQMMLGFEGPGAGGAGTPPPGMNPFLAPGAGMGAGGMPPGMEGMEGLADDPMMKMMQQLMGGAGAGGPGGNPFAGTGLEGLFGGAGGPEGMQAQQAAQAVTDKSANVWRILHAVFALGLGLYIALSTTFTGAKAERDFDTLVMANSASAAPGLEKDGDFASFGATNETARSIEQTRAYFFYVFSSIEAVLLTTRYFLDKNRAPPTGIVWTVSGFLPGNLRSGVRHALRYGEIFSTVRSDALVCVFVLGVCCWLRSA
ncbi:hypothetical protein BJ166DRAFT_524237 [Pestalotiopsis sp. NC0098]|nr:hypothetical protein BJ166DRAFT_524237 [Pestalotiopsis sp. NC0098]